MKPIVTLFFLLTAALSGCAAGIGHGSDIDVRQPQTQSGPQVGDPYQKQSPR